MLAELARFAVGWPLALALVVVVTAQGLASGRRRLALNEALHELRRPLQALALSSPRGSAASVDLTRQAAAALERLEREVNGEAREPRAEVVEVGSLLSASVARWQTSAVRAGGSLALGAPPPDLTVEGDRGDLERALDNLIVNAIEHGRGRVVVDSEVGGRDGAELVRIVIRNGGARSPQGAFAPDGRTNAPMGSLAGIGRFSGRARRGHGLRLVRRTATAHAGELRVRSRDGRMEAAIELPLRRSEGTA